MPSALVIIAADRPDIYAEAQRGTARFGITGEVEVIRDRRVGERRRPGRPFDEASRRNDRRQILVDDQLRRQGWAVVTAEARAAIPPHVPLHMDLGLSEIDVNLRDAD